jgi:hypothetical protein
MPPSGQTVKLIIIMICQTYFVCARSPKDATTTLKANTSTLYDDGIGSSYGRIHGRRPFHQYQRSVRGGGRRIVGGSKATGTFRFVTMIEKLGGQWIGCVGNLIGERWMITAAHCILNAENTGYTTAAPGNTRITYGCLNIFDWTCKQVDAVRYVAHPCYTPSDNQNHDDIALIELSEPVQGMDGQFAWVNGLNGSVSIKEGEDVILAGFGATDPRYSRARTIRP